MKALIFLCVFCMVGGGRVYAQDTAAVPFQFTNGHIFVPIKINGRGPFQAAFDTGGLYLITPDLAKELGMTPHGTLRAGGFGEASRPAALADADSVKIGSLTLLHPKFAVVDIGDLPFKTIIGEEVLREFVVRIDFDTRVLTLTRPDKFVYQGNGTVLPLHLHGHIPAVDGAVDGLQGLFTLDTGSGGGLTLFAPFAQAHDLRRKYAAGFTTATGRGFGGVMQGQSIHIGTLALGRTSVRDVSTVLSAPQGGAASDPDIAGNIGEKVLKQFNITFDYTHGQVILEKNKGYGALEDGYAGLALDPQGTGWRVIDVTPDGPAAKAGIKEGDQVLQIESKDAVQLPIFAVYDIFHRPVGTKVWVLIQAGPQKRLVALTLGKAP